MIRNTINVRISGLLGAVVLVTLFAGCGATNDETTPLPAPSRGEGEPAAAPAPPPRAAASQVQAIFASLENNGVRLKTSPKEQIRHLGRASACAGAMSQTNLLLSVCVYSDDSTFAKEFEESTGAFKPTSNRVVHRNKRTTLSILPYPKSAVGDAEAQRIAAQFNEP